MHRESKVVICAVGLIRNMLHVSSSRDAPSLKDFPAVTLSNVELMRARVLRRTRGTLAEPPSVRPSFLPSKWIFPCLVMTRRFSPVKEATRGFERHAVWTGTVGVSVATVESEQRRGRVGAVLLRAGQRRLRVRSRFTVLFMFRSFFDVQFWFLNQFWHGIAMYDGWDWDVQWMGLGCTVNGTGMYSEWDWDAQWMGLGCTVNGIAMYSEWNRDVWLFCSSARGRQLILTNKDTMDLIRRGIAHSDAAVAMSALKCVTNLALPEEDNGREEIQYISKCPFVRLPGLNSVKFDFHPNFYSSVSGTTSEVGHSVFERFDEVQIRGSLWNYWHPPPFPKRKRQISSSTWNSIILRGSLWGSNPSLDLLNQDRKRGKKSIFERSLNVSLTPSSTSLRVKTAIPCVFSLNFENRGD